MRLSLSENVPIFDPEFPLRLFLGGDGMPVPNWGLAMTEFRPKMCSLMQAAGYSKGVSAESLRTIPRIISCVPFEVPFLSSFSTDAASVSCRPFS
jgi:hypothetical protein